MRKAEIEAQLRRYLEMILNEESDDWDIEVKSRKRKSLTANGYLWVLCRKISEAIPPPRPTDEEVYMDAVRHAGIYVERMIPANMKDDIKKAWESQGIGWIMEHIDFIRREGEAEGKPVLWYNMRLIKGSSSYNRAELDHLISYVVTMAKDMGLETMPPDKLQALLGRVAEYGG